MVHSDIPLLRLRNQNIAAPTFKTPAEVVRWFGAIQAQDFLGALWAVGLRMEKAVEQDIEKALAERTIVRTWPMRGTLHFVAAEDVRWLLPLLTPRIIAKSASRYRDLDLTEKDFNRSQEIFINMLEGGNQLTREELYKALAAEGVSPEGQRGIHMLGYHAQKGLICFGPRRGKQQTFVLLEEWIPKTKTVDRTEALAEITKRYFTSHGPATIRDFVWWTGLTVADAKIGLELVSERMHEETIDGQTYYLPPDISKPNSNHDACLLPAFDEYLVGYKDRNAVLELDDVLKVNAGGGILSPTIVLNGVVLGTWKRILKKDALHISLVPFRPLTPKEKDDISLAASRYGNFLSLPVKIVGSK